MSGIEFLNLLGGTAGPVPPVFPANIGNLYSIQINFCLFTEYLRRLPLAKGDKTFLGNYIWAAYRSSANYFLTP